jgi:alpha-galactosidase
VLGAPLLAGNDLSKMSVADKAILTNREVIAIDQDALGKGGDRLRQIGDLSIWERPLSGGRTAVAIVNASWGGRDVPIDLATIGFPKGAKARDVWSAKDLGRLHGVVNRHLPGHSVILLILSE